MTLNRDAVLFATLTILLLNFAYGAYAAESAWLNLAAVLAFGAAWFSGARAWKYLMWGRRG